MNELERNKESWDRLIKIEKKPPPIRTEKYWKKFRKVGKCAFTNKKNKSSRTTELKSYFYGYDGSLIIY